MAISLKTAGTWAEYTADGSVTIPGSPAAGDRMFLFAAWKDFSITVTDPAGWTSIGAAFADGAVANGNGTGSVKVQAWYRDWKTGDGNPTLDFSTSPNQAGAVIQLWTKAATDSWNDPSTVTAAWPVTATTQTISASSATVVPHDSVVMALIALRDDSATFTRAATTGIDVSSGITWNGNYVESPATHGNFTAGSDGAYDLGHRFVTTGGNVTLRVTATISAVETGSIRWVIQGLGGQGFAQAQAQIKVPNVKGYGQAQALIPNWFFGQARAYIAGTYFLPFSESFNRTTSPGWGTSDNGDTWEHNEPANFQTNGTRGIINTANQVFTAALKRTLIKPPSGAGIEIYVKIQFDAETSSPRTLYIGTKSTKTGDNSLVNGIRILNNNFTYFTTAAVYEENFSDQATFTEAVVDTEYNFKVQIIPISDNKLLLRTKFSY